MVLSGRFHDKAMDSSLLRPPTSIVNFHLLTTAMSEIVGRLSALAEATHLDLLL